MIGITPDDLFRLAVDDAMTYRDRVVESRECICGRRAWLKSRGPDGLKEFQCAEGHQTLTALADVREKA